MPLENPGSRLSQRLAETVKWCQSRLELANDCGVFRIAELCPEPLRLYAQSEWDFVDIPDKESLVEEVAKRRLALLQEAQIVPDTPEVRLAGGRLVLFAPYESLCDGAAAVVSDGFFDGANIPPWDTWIWYGALNRCDVLVSWVPPSFIQHAESGIAANPEGSIRWADSCQVAALLDR